MKSFMPMNSAIQMKWTPFLKDTNYLRKKTTTRIAMNLSKELNL